MGSMSNKKWKHKGSGFAEPGSNRYYTYTMLKQLVEGLARSGSLGKHRIKVHDPIKGISLLKKEG